MAGRPTLLTPERQEKIVGAIREGNYFVAACRAAGISELTGYEWLRRGTNRARNRPTNELFARFAKAVAEAEAAAELKIVGEWRSKVPGSWEAAKEFLARRYPERWSPTYKHEVGGPGGESLVIEIVKREQKPD